MENLLVIPEEVDRLQEVRNILHAKGLWLQYEHYNQIAHGIDNDCYFHSIAILLELSTDQFKDSLLAYVANINNADTISRLTRNHHSSFDALLTRLTIGGNDRGVYCDLYNELVLKVHLVDVQTHYISIHHRTEYSYSTKTSDSITTERLSPSSTRVVNLLLLQDQMTHQASFFPLSLIRISDN